MALWENRNSRTIPRRKNKPQCPKFYSPSTRQHEQPPVHNPHPRNNSRPFSNEHHSQGPLLLPYPIVLILVIRFVDRLIIDLTSLHIPSREILYLFSRPNAGNNVVNQMDLISIMKASHRDFSSMRLLKTRHQSMHGSEIRYDGNYSSYQFILNTMGY